MAYKVGRCLLRERLNDANMTQIELARKLGVAKQQIHNYVTNNRRMSIQIAFNIAEILNCEIKDLYEWIEVGRE